MVLSNGHTFNEEYMLIQSKSQYTVRVISDEAEVFVLDQAQFAKKMK